LIKKFGGFKNSCNFAALFKTEKSFIKKIEKFSKKFAGNKKVLFLQPFLKRQNKRQVL